MNRETPSLVVKIGLALLSLTPVLMAAMYLLWRPPYVTYVDPDMVYYSTAVSIDTGNGIHHIDHPGTPFQCFLAAGLFPFKLKSESAGEPFEFYAFRRADLLIPVLQILCALLMSAGIFLWGMGLSRFTGTGVLGAMSAMAVMILIPQGVLDNVMRLRPEVMLVFMAGLWAALFGTAWERDREQPRWGMVLAFQFAAGLAMAVKLTAFPLALFGVVYTFTALRRSDRERTRTTGPLICALVLMPMAGFLFGILPIIHRLPQFLSWIAGFFSHTGSYGGGEPGAPISFWLSILTSRLKSSTLIFLVIALLIAVFFRSGRGAEGNRDRVKLLAWASLGVAAFSYIPLSRQYPSHYVIMVNLLLALLISTLALKMKFLGRPKGGMVLSTALLCLAAVFIMRTTRRQNAMFRSLERKFKITASALAVPERDQAAIVYTYYAFNPETALLWGGTYSGGNIFARPMAMYYPNHKVWNPWRDILKDYAGVSQLNEDNWKYMVLKSRVYLENFRPLYSHINHRLFANVTDDEIIIENISDRGPPQ